MLGSLKELKSVKSSDDRKSNGDGEEMDLNSSAMS